MTAIKDIMTKSPLTAPPKMDLKEAAKIMNLYEIRHLPVTNFKGEVIGIVSDRDLKLGIGMQYQGVKTVEDVMTPNPYIVSGDTDLAQVISEMRQQKFSCAIVVDDIGQVVGVFTTTDALTILADLTRKQA
jgi:CBS domain-containing protein